MIALIRVCASLAEHGNVRLRSQSSMNAILKYGNCGIPGARGMKPTKISSIGACLQRQSAFHLL
jgi:hypothetical protein